MEYMSVQDASRQWQVEVRQVQSLCRMGKVPGAVRFSRVWAIPATAKKPADGRKRLLGDDGVSADRDELIFNADVPIFTQILEKFPYAISILNPDGIMVYANEAFMEGVLDDVRENTFGIYNVKDEKSLERWGIRDHMEKALRGEYVFTPNLKLPNRELVGIRYRGEYAFKSIYQDMTSFPILDADDRLAYIVTVTAMIRQDVSRREILAGKEYIETHSTEPFDISATARAANLSISRFAKLFKQESSFTPYEYYVRTRLQNLRKRLLDCDISVEQAFAECGMTYNSHYTALFKKSAGMTPTQFRKAHML